MIKLTLDRYLTRSPQPAGPGGLAVWALARRFTTTRSRRPASAQTIGRSSGTSTLISVDLGPRWSSAEPTTASRGTASRCTLSTPACSRLNPNRLSTSSLSVSLDSSMVARSSACASGGRVVSDCRRLETATLIPANGVRRSWPTAASRRGAGPIDLREIVGARRLCR